MGWKEPIKPKERPDEISAGHDQKVKLKTSYNLSHTERTRLLEKEKAQDEKKNRGVPMSESCKIPGPGAYKP